MSYTTTWEEIKSHYRVKDRDFPMLEEDMPTFMGVPHARTAEDLAETDVVIIGAPYVAGAKGKYAGADHRESPDHQQHAQISVACLGDMPEALLATGRVLLGRQSDPGRQIAP